MLEEKNSSAITQDEFTFWRIWKRNLLNSFRTYYKCDKIGSTFDLHFWCTQVNPLYYFCPNYSFLMTEKFSMFLYQFQECDCFVEIWCLFGYASVLLSAAHYFVLVHTHSTIISLVLNGKTLIVSISFWSPLSTFIVWKIERDNNWYKEPTWEMVQLT